MAVTQPAEVPLTRCPKCGGLKRGFNCPNCRGGSGAGVSQQALSAMVAIVGGAICAIGLARYDAQGIRVGTSPAWSPYAGLIGFFICCGGLLWYALLRFLKR